MLALRLFVPYLCGQDMVGGDCLWEITAVCQPRTELMSQIRELSLKFLNRDDSFLNLASGPTIPPGNVPANKPLAIGGVHNWPSSSTTIFDVSASVISPRSFHKMTSSQSGRGSARRLVYLRGVWFCGTAKCYPESTGSTAKPTRMGSASAPWLNGIACNGDLAILGNKQADFLGDWDGTETGHFPLANHQSLIV